MKTKSKLFRFEFEFFQKAMLTCYVDIIAYCTRIDLSHVPAKLYV